jgi:hypothetical protein
MVGRGATVLMRKFGSAVGGRVAVAGSEVAVGKAGSSVGVGGSVPVGVQGMGWKGVGVGVAFGATVTSANGWEAGTLVPHPDRRSAARMIQRRGFMERWFWRGRA